MTPEYIFSAQQGVIDPRDSFVREESFSVLEGAAVRTAVHVYSITTVGRGFGVKKLPLRWLIVPFLP